MTNSEYSLIITMLGALQRQQLNDLKRLIDEMVQAREIDATSKEAEDGVNCPICGGIGQLGYGLAGFSKQYAMDCPPCNGTGKVKPPVLNLYQLGFDPSIALCPLCFTPQMFDTDTLRPNENEVYTCECCGYVGIWSTPESDTNTSDCDCSCADGLEHIPF